VTRDRKFAPFLRDIADVKDNDCALPTKTRSTWVYGTILDGFLCYVSLIRGEGGTR
jgi:hypothetical protein